MSPDQIKLAKQRLRLGITNVGFWVISTTAGLYALKRPGSHSPTGARVMGLLLAALLAQAIFDVIGGCVLMPYPQATRAIFLKRWLRGMAVHSLLMGTLFALSYASFRMSGGFCFAVLLGTTGLAFARVPILQAIGGIPIHKEVQGDTQILIADVDDPSFTGGITGFGKKARSLMPRLWFDQLPDAELAVEGRRRQWQMDAGLEGRAFLLLLLWNMVGSSIGTVEFKLASRLPIEALSYHFCWMTLWGFLGLLILPRLSQKAVFAADQAFSREKIAIESWIRHFPELVGEDGNPGSKTQAVFYPIPSTVLRQKHLNKATSGFIPGSLARNNLYYSWATLTLIGRSVHCNAGRPALWVFPPSA